MFERENLVARPAVLSVSKQVVGRAFGVVLLRGANA